MVTIADCERVQAGWFAYRATGLGGAVWEDDGTLWTDGPDGLNLLFPRRISRAAVGRGLDRARDLGHGIVGAWLSLDVDAAVLGDAGFERGWSPWWMSADLADVPRVADARVRLEQESLDYEAHDPEYRAQLALTRVEPARCWHAAARTGDGRFVGRAWSFLDQTGAVPLAGVFDMDVWPPFRRQGFGRALLSTVCAAAADAGAGHAVLNATPEGKALYETCGFTRLGEGITWWHHLGTS